MYVDASSLPPLPTFKLSYKGYRDQQMSVEVEPFAFQCIRCSKLLPEDSRATLPVGHECGQRR